MASSSTPTTAPTKRVSVLFVCLGNICRSTMAEAVFRHLAAQHPLIATIDSCGTGAYHAGADPDSRTLSVLADQGLTSYTHAARRVQAPEDFEKFDYVLAMDVENLSDLRDLVRRAAAGKGTLRQGALARVRLFGEFGGRSKKEEIGDPYYGGREGFEVAYEQVLRCGKGLLKHIEEEGAKL